jgi:DNA-binding response OmpR family regulator
MKKLKILFVDDDINLGGFISTVLETDYNYRVHFQNTLLGIDTITQTLEPDIIILDVEIGEDNGIDKAKDIVAKHPQIPIIFISSHTEDEFITRGINTGGNAYLPKPLSIPVLVSYIQRFTNTRQQQQQQQQQQLIEISNYQLNLITNELSYKRQLVKKLSPFEKNALELLMLHPNAIVTKEQFAEKLWGQSLETQNIASLNNTLSKLRDLFKDNSSLRIDTIRGIGYILHCK